jgi:hypothetical protein
MPFPSVAEERWVSFNFWPLFQYTSDSQDGLKEIEGLGPFFLWKKGPGRMQWGIRPVIFWTEDDSESLRRLEIPYPIGKYQVKNGEKRGYVAPLSLYREEEIDGKMKWDFQIFPFFIGATIKGEGYSGIFPFFGTLLNRYGKEEIRFYFWPLYAESISEGVHTTNLLWPFFSFIEGEKKRGYRFWPIYGQREEVGISQMEFFIWPLFLKQRKGMDTDDPIDEKMFFPIYVSKESQRLESRTYLWPFFTFAKDRLTGFEQLDFPWPIFQSLKGENLKGIRIFPLYGDKVKKGEMRRTFIFYPIYQLEEDRMGDVHEQTIRILLLSRIRTGDDIHGVKKEHSLRIWPFFDYEREGTGDASFSLFYLFPFKDEGFERNLFPLFRIFRWQKDPQGNTSSNLLWGLCKRVKKKEMDSWELAHLIGVKRGNGWHTLSLLKGLFWYKKERETNELRLFYLPFRIQWSHCNSTNPSLAKRGEGELFMQHKEDDPNFF